ncbi:MAG: Bacterial regulatory protein, Fis family, partial [Firmicutes bacterium]|nr:Bacterial regulatory protein, Fis family [Bacillota bacterium]
IMQDQQRHHEKTGKIVTAVESAGKYREHQKSLQAQQEKQEIKRLMEIYGGNITRIAESKGVSRNTIYRRMKRYGIEL